MVDKIKLSIKYINKIKTSLNDWFFYFLKKHPTSDLLRGLTHARL